jgi:hypothetical protein
MNVPNDFPIHDAELLTVRIDPEGRDRFQLRIDVQVHDGESIDELIIFDIAERTCTLVFAGCWAITTSLSGMFSMKESFDRWNLVSNSNLLQRVMEMGCRPQVDLQHHHFTFSGGSLLDVLAEKVSVLPLNDAASAD